MIWEVTLTHPGRPPLCFMIEHMGPTIERPVLYRYKNVYTDEWRSLSTSLSGLFVETYEVYDLMLMPPRALARYKGLRRCGQLERHFNPKRLPA